MTGLRLQPTNERSHVVVTTFLDFIDQVVCDVLFFVPVYTTRSPAWYPSLLMFGVGG